MNRQEFDKACQRIDESLGGLKMTWEGPGPHDFRQMKERGVRFVNSGLFCRLPYEPIAYIDAKVCDGETIRVPRAFPSVDYSPDGKIECNVLVGDQAAEDDVTKRIEAAGYKWTRAAASEFYWQILFEVPAQV